MQRKHEGGEPRSRDGQAAQDHEQQQGCGGVQSEVRQVVAKHRVAPQSVLDPEGSVKDRIVLLRGPQVGPDAPEAMERPNSGLVTCAVSSQRSPPLRAGR